MSSIHSSSVGRPPSGTGSDRPVPRLSSRISRLNDATRSSIRANGGTSHCEVDVAPPLVDEEDVDRTIPEGLIREMDIARSRVSRLRPHASMVPIR